MIFIDRRTDNLFMFYLDKIIDNFFINGYTFSVDCISHYFYIIVISALSFFNTVITLVSGNTLLNINFLSLTFFETTVCISYFQRIIFIKVFLYNKFEF